MAPTPQNSGWTPERRARHGALIRSKKPWLRSTGPRTRAGKAISALNARKHGLRGAEMRGLRQYFRECRATILLARMHIRSLKMAANFQNPKLRDHFSGIFRFVTLDQNTCNGVCLCRSPLKALVT